MTQASKDQPSNRDQAPKPGKNLPFPSTNSQKGKQKAEQQEIAGRHKNDGQKDHKGAR